MQIFVKKTGETKMIEKMKPSGSKVATKINELIETVNEMRKQTTGFDFSVKPVNLGVIPFPATSEKPCKTCGGLGLIAEQCGITHIHTTCPDCTPNSTQEQKDGDCKFCNGTGCIFQKDDSMPAGYFSTPCPACNAKSVGEPYKPSVKPTQTEFVNFRINSQASWIAVIEAFIKHLRELNIGVINHMPLDERYANITISRDKP